MLARDQEVGGSNPLAPTQIPSISLQSCCAESVCLFCGHGQERSHPPFLSSVGRGGALVGNSPLGSLAHLGVARAEFAGLGGSGFSSEYVVLWDAPRGGNVTDAARPK